MALPIREAQPTDGPALTELERLSPEEGRVAVRIEFRTDHLSLVARYPGAKGYVALAEDGATIIGTIFSSVAPTQINGKLVPAAYLFSLRVHPNYRRRGVAFSLIDFACGRAREEAGAHVAWAAIIEGNEASLKTFTRAGFGRIRDLHTKIVIGGLTWPHHLTQLATRPALLSDLQSWADALNEYYVGYNLWRPLDPERLLAELQVTNHSLDDTEVAHDENGKVVAAASALELVRIARLRLLRYNALPAAFNRLLGPFLGLIPLNPLMVRHFVFDRDQPSVGASVLQSLHRRYLPRSWASIVTADPLDPVWKALGLMWGLTGLVHLVVKSDEPIDHSLPSYTHSLR